MPPKQKVRRPSSITVGQFFERHAEALQLKLIGEEVGLDRKISEPTVNRPGLALSGHFKYFAYRRIQVIGNSERSYLVDLTVEERLQRYQEVCDRKIPCIVISRGKKPPEGILEVANRNGIAVFRSPMVSMKFMNAATIMMERDFAPTVTEHGSMIDVRGIGVLIRGASGTGKSESVLGLLDRGASLVADDMVRFQPIDDELRGTPPFNSRSHMEVRGLGIINVAALFGIGSIRLEKRLDMVVTLKSVADINEIDRVGLDRQEYEILKIRVPHIELPVAPGRDLAGLIELAALDQKLRSFGVNSAMDFENRLLESMQAPGIK